VTVIGFPSLCRGTIGYVILRVGVALASTDRLQDQACTMLDGPVAVCGMVHNLYSFDVLSLHLLIYCERRNDAVDKKK
jgi:hypothetical protein